MEWDDLYRQIVDLLAEMDVLDLRFVLTYIRQTYRKRLQ